MGTGSSRSTRRTDARFFFGYVHLVACVWPAGYNCTISPFPEYKGDPLGERIAREKKDKEEEKKALVRSSCALHGSAAFTAR